MKCFNCGKNFDYEKYYGICPKCGCYNKEESAEELHQEMHDTYDNGYRHDSHPQGENGGYTGQGPADQGHQAYGNGGYHGNILIHEVTPQKKKGGTKFLVISILVFLFVFIGGTAAGMLYESAVEKKLQKEILEVEAGTLEHASGETFAFQDLMLKVTEACTLAHSDDLNLPQGKKLIGVHITGTGDGEWKDENWLSEAYITYENTCYWQISYYDYEAYGNIYRKPAFDPYGLRNASDAEGWIAFLVDEDVDSFTLCLEERTGENQVWISNIHTIPLQLSEEENNGESH